MNAAPRPKAPRDAGLPGDAAVNALATAPATASMDAPAPAGGPRRRPLAAVLALLPLLAACAAKPPATPQAECEAAAFDDPVVKQFIIRRTAMVEDTEYLLRDQKLAERDATVRCMRQKGLAPPGGVERMTPPR